MILEEKTYFNKDIAGFFHVNPATFTRTSNKEKYLRLLSNYAEWELTEKGKIRIKKVLRQEEYEKFNPQERRNYMLKGIVEGYYPNDFHCTIKDIAEEFYDYDKMKIKKESFYKNDCNTIFKDLFGKTFRYTNESFEGCYEGLIGERKYVYVVYDDKIEAYRWLTTKEEEIKRQIIKKYYGTIDERTAELKSHLEGEFYKGELTEAELKDNLVKMFLVPREERYDLFMQEMNDRIGIIRREFCCMFKEVNEILSNLRQSSRYTLTPELEQEIRKHFVFQENII